MRRSTHESRDRRTRSTRPRPGVRERTDPERARWSSAQRSSARCVARSSWRVLPACRSVPTRASVACCWTRAARRSRRGTTAGPGRPHAEAAALTEAGADARGATAVVTLEPCNHTGRTGPCAEALAAAGVARVVFAQPDPNPVAAGGEVTLREAGVEVAFGSDGARGAGAQPGVDVRDGAPPAVRHLEVRRDLGRAQRRRRRQQPLGHLEGRARRLPPTPRPVRRDAGRRRHRRGRRPGAHRARRVRRTAGPSAAPGRDGTARAGLGAPGLQRPRRDDPARDP